QTCAGSARAPYFCLGVQCAMNLTAPLGRERIDQRRQWNRLGGERDVVLVTRHAQVQIGVGIYGSAVQPELEGIEQHVAAVHLRHGVKIGDLDFVQVEASDGDIGGKVAERKLDGFGLFLG